MTVIKKLQLLGLKKIVCCPSSDRPAEIAVTPNILLLFSKQYFILFVPGTKDKPMLNNTQNGRDLTDLQQKI